MADSFGVQLQERIKESGPLCVGVDPSSALLSAWDRPDNADGLEFFALAVLEAVTGVVSVIKPQVAFFERFGSAGFRVLERLILDAHDAQIMVIADAKRGDFVVTNEGYAQAWLRDESPLAVDAVTASPYLGVDALSPLFDAARASGRGVFVLDRRRRSGRRRGTRARGRYQSSRRRTRLHRRRARRDTFGAEIRSHHLGRSVPGARCGCTGRRGARCGSALRTLRRGNRSSECVARYFARWTGSAGSARRGPALAR
jgi:orotidine-5'-phosphate decarboxylase